MIKIRKKAVGMQIVGNKANQGNVQRKISFSIHSPTFILLAIGFVLQNLPAKTESNPTAPNIYLENYSGDFTDSDQDGMSDIAELRYGFDPEDKSSFPRQSYFLDDLGITINDITDDSEIGSSSDRIYFYFSKFSHDMEHRTKEFMYKLFPILYDRLGYPSRTIACKLHNRGGSSGSWMASSSGTRIYANNTWNPRLLIHEIIHVWGGKYKLSSNQNWQWNKMLSGFEEVAEGMAYEILNEYIHAYPNDPESIFILKGGAWDEWSGRFSNYDLVKHQRWTEGGDFWIDPFTSNDRYNISSVLFQTFLKHDKYFYRKVFERFYDMIESDESFRPTRESIIELWSNVLPQVNGVPTAHYLKAMPILNGNKLKPELYPIALPNARFSNGGKQKLFCVFPDNKKGEFWWSSSIYDSNIQQFGIPSWFKKFKGSDNFYYSDNRKQPYVVKVHNTLGGLVNELKGELNNPTRSSDGGPSTIATATPTSLDGKNYEIGLYRMTLEFPYYQDFTEHYKEDSYFFGYHNFKQNKTTDRTIFVGIDSLFETSYAEMFFNGKTYSANINNGCAIFNIESLNEEGVAKILIHSLTRNRTNTYQRAIIVGGTADGYRHQPILIIDQDFDGNEDLYEQFGTVIAFKDNNSTVDENSTILITSSNSNNKINQEEETTSTKKQVGTGSPTYSLDLNITEIVDGVSFDWNEPVNSSLYLELLHGQKQIIYGGHESNRATLYLADHNLTGSEILMGRFLCYENSVFQQYLNEFTLNLAEIISVEKIDLFIDANNSTFLVEGVSSIEADEANTTLVNTSENVESISEYSEENSSKPENVVVVSNENNVSLEIENEQVIEEETVNSILDITTEVITTNLEESNQTKDQDIVRKAPEPHPVLKNAWDRAISVGNNWYHLEWFGYFYKDEENNWVYHETLGWFYTDWTTTFESIWVYHDIIGWAWTSLNYFPYLYNSEKNDWFYLINRAYFDFSQNAWIKLDSI
jgi:hypothetical protein